MSRYDDVIDSQGVDRLAELDRWYRQDFPAAISGRDEPFIQHDELVELTKWKMARGVWRGRNLALVKGNAPELVEEVSRRALSLIPDPRGPIRELAKLAGVGPATASAVTAATAPGVYPFFDEVVADQVPELGKVAYTLKYYAEYSDALRARAADLGGKWTPVLVERALWANAGGKAG
ncbi:MAG TPA: hypothetical protein VFI91_01500 [Longimicrobiaceae bacterium]|nr:hypothetical protein [Longimicrobiaceae bacterium]